MQNAALDILNERLTNRRDHLMNNKEVIETWLNQIHDTKIMNSNLELEIGQLESAIAAVKRNIANV